MKNILIISQYYYPDTFKINEISQKLINEGFGVDVVTGLPDYPSGIIPKEFKNFKKRNESFGDVNVHRVSTFARKKGPINRVLNYLSFALNGSCYIWFSNKKKYDYVFVYQVSPVTMILPGIVAKRRYKIPLIVYCLDIWPEAVKVMGFKDGSFLFKVIAKISKNIYSKVTKFAVSSRAFVNYMSSTNGILKEKLTYLPQHSDTMDSKNENLSGDILKKENGVKNFVFTGNIGRVQDVETIVEAAYLSKNKDSYMIHIIGDGSRLETVKALVREKNINNIIFYGRISYDKMPQILQEADACLLTLKHDNEIGLTIPTKLQTYMAAGKPILAAIDGDARNIIKDSNCGATTNSGNALELSNIFDDISDNNYELDTFEKNSKKYFNENFTADIFINKLINIMEEATNE